MSLSSLIARSRLFFPAFLIRGLLGILTAFLIAASAPAQITLYWDLNGATAGSGVTPTGIWDTTTANWSASAAGTVATTLYAPASVAVFSAGTDAAGSYTVTVSGTQNAVSISVVSGNPTFSGGTITLSGAIPTFSVASGMTATVNSVVDDLQTGTTKTGTGTLILAGANSNLGGLTVNAGVVNLRNNLALGNSGAGAVVASGAALELQNNITITGEPLQLSGSGIGGTGALRNISGINSYADNITLTAATEIQSDAGSLTLSGGVSGATFGLTFDGAGNTAVSGVIGTTSGTLTKNGTGTLTLSRANTYTGATAINAGTLRINADNRLGTAPGAATPNKLTFDGGTLETTASFILSANRGVTINAGGGTFDVNAGTLLFYNGILAGAGTLNKTDTGILWLGGATTNTHTGDINVNAGTLWIAKSVANTAIGDAANVTVATGANLTFIGGVSETIGSLAGGGTVDNFNAAALTLTTGGNNASTNFSGVIQDTGGNLTLTKTGTGTLTLSGTTANTFAGNLNINDGTVALSKTAGVNAFAGSTINIGDGTGAADSAVLRLAASNQIVNTAALVFATDGRLDLNGQTETVASIAGSGEILIGTGSLISAGNASTTFSGQLTGTTGSFTKQGSGTLTLASMINYDGVFNLNSGTLQLSSITANIGTLNITGNTTIDFAGTASTLNVTTFNISVGVVLSIINWTNATDYFFAQNWTGAVANTTGIAPMNQVVFTGFTGNDTKWQGYDNQVTPVPEPATYGALLLGALTGLFAWRRFRRAGLVARPAGHAHVATGL